jgi:hypothetical protein
MRLTPEQHAELEVAGAAAADWFEAEDPDPAGMKPTSELSPQARLRYARHTHAIAVRDADQQLRDAVGAIHDEGFSWHKIGQEFGITGEGARKKFSHA